jgi:hypothetical protein
MAQMMQLNRNLSDKDNYSGRALKRGEIVYLYDGCTYGCISAGGVAVTFQPSETPFFQVPEDSLSAPAEDFSEQERRTR